MKKIMYLCLLSLSIIGACKKTETPAVSVRLDKIAGDDSKDWFIRNVVVTITQNGADRQLNLLLECESDDKWTFSRDGKLIVNDNLSKCQGQAPERLNTTWFADDTFDNMTITNWRLRDSGNLADVNFTVSNLSDTTMTLSTGGLFANTKAVVINYRTR